MSTEVKPIVVINLPANFTLGDGRNNAPMKLMEALNGNFGQSKPDDKIKYSDYWKDYLWFCFYDNNPELTAPIFNVHYPKDFSQTQYEDLKKLITDAINNFKK